MGCAHSPKSRPHAWAQSKVFWVQWSVVLYLPLSSGNKAGHLVCPTWNTQGNLQRVCCYKLTSWLTRFLNILSFFHVHYTPEWMKSSCFSTHLLSFPVSCVYFLWIHFNLIPFRWELWMTSHVIFSYLVFFKAYILYNVPFSTNLRKVPKQQSIIVQKLLKTYKMSTQLLWLTCEWHCSLFFGQHSPKYSLLHQMCINPLNPWLFFLDFNPLIYRDLADSTCYSQACYIYCYI